MLRLSEDQRDQLRDAVAVARARPDLRARVETLYADVQRQIDLRKPRCDVSGRCCRFEEYGHRLFVTTLEVAAFAAEIGSSDGKISLDDRVEKVGGACPYQINKLCSVHTIRPFGCRIFFCDPDAKDWQQQQYEQFHLRLRELHMELTVPYLYVEWLEALRALELAAT